MTCCFCFFAEGLPVPDRALAAAREYRRVFPRRPFFLLAPEGFEGLSAYMDALGPVHVRRIPAVAAASVRDRGMLRLTPDFYDFFADYDYVVVASLRSTWPMYDALNWWMEQGYDYVAAPWLGLGGSSSPWVRGLDLPRGGRDAMSLRRVGAMREFARRVRTCGFDVEAHAGMYEDTVLSGGLPDDYVRDLPEVRYCPRAEQARFAWDRPSYEPTDAQCDVRTLKAVTRGRLPMFLFDPSDDVRRDLCGPYREPERVFVFSSAVKPEYDYRGLVDSVEPDPSKRLLVFLNACQAFRGNESGLALVRSQDRIVTMHNDTVVPPFGPSCFGEIPLFLEKAGYRGRHESLTLRWRPWSSKTRAVATFDGEMPDEDASRVLRSITTEVVSGAPTAGYQAYRILRDRHPDAEICLVNFFGNSNGFSVCRRHDPTWERAVYERDPKVRMLYCR